MERSRPKVRVVKNDMKKVATQANERDKSNSEREDGALG